MFSIAVLMGNIFIPSAQAMDYFTLESEINELFRDGASLLKESDDAKDHALLKGINALQDFMSDPILKQRYEALEFLKKTILQRINDRASHPLVIDPANTPMLPATPKKLLPSTSFEKHCFLPDEQLIERTLLPERIPSLGKTLSPESPTVVDSLLTEYMKTHTEYYYERFKKKVYTMYNKIPQNLHPTLETYLRDLTKNLQDIQRSPHEESIKKKQRAIKQKLCRFYKSHKNSPSAPSNTPQQTESVLQRKRPRPSAGKGSPEQKRPRMRATTKALPPPKDFVVSNSDQEMTDSFKRRSSSDHQVDSKSHSFGRIRGSISLYPSEDSKALEESATQGLINLLGTNPDAPLFYLPEER
jgi:hypothetical protein